MMSFHLLDLNVVILLLSLSLDKLSEHASASVVI